jgi:hypothetical protein
MVIPQQTSLVIYRVSLIVTIREPSAPTITKPKSTNPKGGIVDPEKKKVNINITLLVGNSRRGRCPDMLNISYQGYLND